MHPTDNAPELVWISVCTAKPTRNSKVLEKPAHKSELTPVTSKELGNGLPILQAVGPSKDSIEALVIVHIGAGNSGTCLPCVQGMTLQQAASLRALHVGLQVRISM